MSEALAARKFIVDFLRKEIVGPSPGFPAIQLDGQEILRPQDPPRHRYSAGILFPMRSQVPSQEETGAEEYGDQEASSLEPNQIIQDSKDSDALGEVDSTDTENTPDTDQEVSLANEFLPSAMGLSALLEITGSIQVEVQAGIYQHQELQSNRKKQTGDGNKTSYTKGWWRVPVNHTIVLSATDLLEEKLVAFEIPVEQEGEVPVLSLHVVSRPHQQSSRCSRTRLITFTLINRRRSESVTLQNSECFFQCGFSVASTDGSACFLSYPEKSNKHHNKEELTLQLLYLHRRTFAVGHGCAADWHESDSDRTTLIRTEVMPTYEIKPVLPTQFSGLDLSMKDLSSDNILSSTDLCRRLCEEYDAWIIEREIEIDQRTDLTLQLKKTAIKHMKDCRECLRRMRDGIEMLQQDNDVKQAFQLMNEAMYMQQAHYEISSRKTRMWIRKSGNLLELERPFDRPNYGGIHRKWRPFQLAFILMNLKAISDPHCSERKIVDVIWFPTGGGKTEAYLGLSAFCMFLRRLRDPRQAGTSILMRYTLRLLTTQQYQRAASLICACEVLRRREQKILGDERFTIGLWVGSAITPNSEDDAVKTLQEMVSSQGVNKFILLSCPWCGAAMGPQRIGNTTKCKGYKRLANPKRVRHICEDPNCDFNIAGDGLPVAVIDEHIYDSPPTLLIGTVDKFAMLTFKPKARRLFGIDTPHLPPELIIQDELHLISGPLGSMVGHYETVVNALCVHETADKKIHAKIIASTATISQAYNQVNCLYGRDAFLFPPQALKAGDSFFAEEREDQEGRLYVGVFATALPSHVTAQIRTMGALLQAPKCLNTKNPETIDPYWTMMGYFNSLRELGHAATLIRADIREFLNAMWRRLGFHLIMGTKSNGDLRRFLKPSIELTSRIQSNHIPAILQRLFASYSDSTDTDVVDVCFATNMIQVGLDVPRLSLMTIVGQPKSTSEYIQASSRVGRDLSRPGIVVTNYNPFKARDRSHYEHFRSYHQSIYRHVEPTSVTSFAAPVRDRALHALIVILCRFWGGDQLRRNPSPPPDPELVEKIKKTIRERVMAVDPVEWLSTEALIDEIIQRWSTTQPSRYGDFGKPHPELPLLYPAGGQQHENWQNWPYGTPISMRNVDANCSARPLFNGYGSSTPTGNEWN